MVAFLFSDISTSSNPSRWPRGGCWDFGVRIPPGAWLFLVNVVCCQPLLRANHLHSLPSVMWKGFFFNLYFAKFSRTIVQQFRALLLKNSSPGCFSASIGRIFLKICTSYSPRMPDKGASFFMIRGHVRGIDFKIGVPSWLYFDFHWRDSPKMQYVHCSLHASAINYAVLVHVGQ
jgi:hypothetical protein